VAKLQVRQKIRADRPRLGRHDQGRLHYRKEGGVATGGSRGERMLASGIQPEDNILSRGILQMRED
jgi:hypothetical protein